MDRSIQLIAECDHFKFSEKTWMGQKSRKVICQICGYYRKQKSFSSEYTLLEGVQLAIPWSSKLEKVIFIFSYVDERVKVEIGSSTFKIPTDSSFKTDGEENRIRIDVTPNGAERRVGKVWFTIYIQKLYDDSDDADRVISNKLQRRKHQDPSILLAQPPIDFKFKRLNKAINWQKVSTIDLDK
jgi:hypothetical protein